MLFGFKSFIGYCLICYLIAKIKCSLGEGGILFHSSRGVWPMMVREVWEQMGKAWEQEEEADYTLH